MRTICGSRVHVKFTLYRMNSPEEAESFFKFFSIFLSLKLAWLYCTGNAAPVMLPLSRQKDAFQVDAYQTNTMPTTVHDRPLTIFLIEIPLLLKMICVLSRIVYSIGGIVDRCLCIG